MIVLEKANAGCGTRSAIRGGTMVHLGYSEFAFSLQPLMQCPYSHQTQLKHLTSHSEALIRRHNGVWLVLAGMDQTQVRCWKQEMAAFFLSSAWKPICQKYQGHDDLVIDLHGWRTLKITTFTFYNIPTVILFFKSNRKKKSHFFSKRNFSRNIWIILSYKIPEK